MKRRILLLTALCMLPLVSPASDINDGVKLLNKGKLKEAAETLEKAEDTNPALAEYNLGNAQYGLKQFHEAAQSYENAMRTTDLRLQQYSAYNSGNALLAELSSTGDALDTKKKLELAKKGMQMYRHAIELEPSDIAAKQNFERAKKMVDQLQEQQKKEQQQQKDQNQKQNQQKQDQQQNKKQDQQNQDKQKQDQQDQKQKQEGSDQQKDQQKQNQDQQKQDQQQNQQQDQQNQDQQQGTDSSKQESQAQENQQQSQQPESQPKDAEEMTRQEAQQLLDSMKQDEQDKRPTIMYGRPQRVEKDW